MKRNLLLFIATIATHFGIAQVEVFPVEEFTGSIPDDWTIIDVDGNTASSPGFAPYAGWGYFQDPDYYFQCAASAASYEPEGTSDDWLITPTISVPASGDMLLTYKCKSRWPGAQNDYEIRMSIGDDATDPADFTYVIYAEDVVPTTWQWESFMLPDEALGNDIHLAFREITSEGNLFCLDDVAVHSLHADDIGFYSVYPDKFVEAGPQLIKGTVQNRGVNTITSYTLSWDDGTGPNSTTISDVIAPWDYAYFEHPVMLDAASGTYYDINVTVTVDGDGDAENGNEDTWISCVSSKPQKYVVGEKRTGTWCGWCPRGTVGMQNMEDVPTWIGIAVHGGNFGSDPMEHTIYNDELDRYIPFGFPTTGVDRYHTYVDPDDYLEYHDLRVEAVAPAVITVNAALDGSNLDVTVNAEMYGKIAAGDYRLACVVTEDGVTGTTDGFNQNNYYSFEASDLPLVGEDRDWQASPNPVPADEMVYDHVARLLGDDEINGTAGSLPSVVEIDEVASHTYSFDIAVIDNIDNCHFIGMLIDNETGVILQAGVSDSYLLAGIEEETSFDLVVYPNPTNEIANIKLNLDRTSEVSVQLFNTTGALVYSNMNTELAAGEQYLQLNLSDLASGIYAVCVSVNGDMETIKIIKQ